MSFFFRQKETTERSQSALCGLLTILLFSLIGLYLAKTVNYFGIGDPLRVTRAPIFLYLFVYLEPPLLRLELFLALFFLLLPWRGRLARLFIKTGISEQWSNDHFWTLTGVISFLIFSLALLGTHFVFHDFRLSMDEYIPFLQAHSLAAGKITLPLPHEFIKDAPAITSPLLLITADNRFWISGYLPVYSLFLIFFNFFGIAAYTNSFFAAGSILALAAAARRLYPDEGEKTFLAVLFLATSTQFLLMSMTGYTWPAHLCLNLLWVYLYVTEWRGGKWLAPWIGVLALGLHQPVAHALFVAPFLVRLLLTRQWRWTFYYGIVYGAAFVFYFFWERMAFPTIATEGVTLFVFPDAALVMTRVINLVDLFSWQSIPFAVLLMVSFGTKSSSPVLADLKWGCFLTFIFYLFIPYDQGHGWGYRYIYSVLGNAALLAPMGWSKALREKGASWCQDFVLIGFAVAILVQFPLRAIMVERFVAPYPRAYRAILTRPEKILILDPLSSYYSCDLIRNDPAMPGPLLMRSDCISESRLKELLSQKNVGIVTAKELWEWGLLPTHYGLTHQDQKLTSSTDIIEGIKN